MKKQTAILIILCLFLGSCSQNEDAFLEVTATNDRAFLIPADASSCKSIKTATATSPPSDDIAGKYFTVRGLKFKWKHTVNRVDIAMVRLKIKNRNLGGGEINCQIAGDELIYLAPIGWDGSILPVAGSSSVEQTTDCNLRCGGVTTEKKSFVAGGTIEVIGYMTEPNGDQAPVRASMPFSVENLE